MNSRDKERENWTFFQKAVLATALLGLFSLGLLFYSLPDIFAGRRLLLENDSLRQRQAHLEDLASRLRKLQQDEYRLQRLLGRAMGLAVDTTVLRSAIPGTALDDLGNFARGDDQIPSLNPVGGVISRGFEPLAAYPHPGVDLAGRLGDPVSAAADGYVTFAGWTPQYGNLVIVTHARGFVTRYGHLQTVVVHDGERVYRGQMLGGLGDTGLSTGPHLHYEVWHNGRPLDPRRFLF